MHTIDQLEEALAVARKLGYGIRHEWLGGVPGGACEVGGKKWLFVDLALNAIEQLDLVVESLKIDPAIHRVPVSDELGDALDLRRAA